MNDYTFLAIADVHLGLKLFNLPELAQDLKDNFARIADLAIRLKVNYVFIAGDMFEHNKPSPDLIEFVRVQVKKLNANNIIVAGIAGDHDKPINGASWIHLCNVVPASQVDKRFVGMDYCDDSPQLVTKLAQLTYKDKVEWIFLHGHVPELFKWAEEKKLLDIKQLDMLATFPNLKGVILGDIHVPTDSTIHDPTGLRSQVPYIGYCGSLGITKTDEIGQKTGILYYDGKVIKRVPFKLDRHFVRFHLSNSLEPINWVNKFTAFFRNHEGKKPVIIIEYDNKSKELLPITAPLYEVGIVKKARAKMKNSEEEEEQTETINIRSELKTNNRIESVLKEMLPDKESFDLVYSLLNNIEDPAMVLDELKEKYLGTDET
jgi:DNA repair exonuclease SbcCD nuclease subunit